MRTTKAVAALVLAAAVSACAPLPSAPGEGDATAPPVTPGDVPGAADAPATAGAVAALLEQSRGYRAAGDHAGAAATLERAVRIEPADPWLWLELAEVHVAAGNLPQARSHAQKARAVAGGDAAAREAADELLARLGTR